MDDLILAKQVLWGMLLEETPIEEIKELEKEGYFGNLWVDAVVEEFYNEKWGMYYD